MKIEDSIVMYAYVDESGNTGSNIFDSAQPIFITAALITKTNFDILYKKEILKIAKLVDSTELHANKLGLEKVDIVCKPLLKLLKKSNSRFFISRIEKKYLLASKFFDTLFDSYENKAVSWHHYNLRPMRLLLLFKFSRLITEKSAELFWSSILDTNEKRSKIRFLESLEDVESLIHTLPDPRSKEVIIDAIIWAKENPESIYTHINSKAARLGHLPNLAAFPNLLGGIENRSKLWKRRVVEVVHDRQSQFQGALRSWHELHKNAPKDTIELPFGEKYTLRRLEGSNFRISSGTDSAGIQTIDVIIWLFKRVLDGKELGYYSSRLINHVFKRAYQNDLSFEGVSKQLESMFGEIYNKPFTEEDQRKAEELLEFAEEKRQEEMFKYTERKKQ